MWDHLGPWDLHLNKLGKGPLSNTIYTKCKASQPNVSEKDFWIIFMYFYGLNLGPPGAGPSLNLGPSFEHT